MPSLTEQLRSLTGPLRGLTEPVRGLLPGKRPAGDRDREIVVTPWEWADEGGLYVGDDGAWLYRQLPLTLLTPAGRSIPLDGLIASLAAKLPGREVHLVSHTWEAPPTIPAGTPEQLADYLRSGLDFLVPVRSLLLGLKLQAEVTADEGKLRVLLPALLTTTLGEQVPNFPGYDTDRALVEEALGDWTAGPPQRSVADYLESWFTLGNGPEVNGQETQDAVLAGEHGAIECASVMGFPEAAELLAAGLPALDEGGATVVSVRGRLTDTEKARGSDVLRAGTLHACSVVLGRRVMHAVDSWVDALRTQPGIELRPLPLRQLDALNETLPCSTRRVNATLDAVGAARLARVGVREPALAGDPLGLYLGLADPGLSHPCYLNPAAEGVLTVVTGGNGAGKTFLAESLAVQSALAGMDVVVLSTATRSGSAVLELVGGMDVALGAAGHLDPFGYADPQRAAELAAAVLPGLIDGITAAESEELVEALHRGARTGATGVQQCLAGVGDPTTVARLRRAQRRSPYLPLLAGADAQPLLSGPVSVVDLGWLLPLAPETGPTDPDAAEEQAAAAALVDLAVACVLERVIRAGSAAGTLVIVDGAAAVLDGPLTASSLARLRAQPHPRAQLVLTTAATGRAARSPLARSAERVIVLAEADPAAAEAAQELVGLPADPARSAWLSAAGPVVEDGLLQRAALGLHRDTHHRQTSLLIGPVPAAALAALTRGATADG